MTTPKEPFADFAQINRQMLEVLKPFADIQERLKALNFQTSWIAEYQKAASQIIESTQHIVRSLAPMMPSATEFANRIAALERRSRLLDQAGWLPHYTTPFHLIDEC